MVEPSTPVPAPPAERLNYQPLSLLAVVGLLLSGLYGAVVVLSTMVALFQATPVFFGGWLLVLPISGALLSALALWRIQASEGTLAGRGLAVWGLGVSMVAMLGYVAYELATALALRQQVQRFLSVKEEDSGFFPRLFEGDIHGAFLLTLPVTSRAGANPHDAVGMAKQFDAPQGPNPKGMLTMFQEHELVHALLQVGQEKQTPEPLGAGAWTFEKKSFRVERQFRLRTSLMVADLVMTIRTSEGTGPGGGRKWFISWGETYLLPTSLQFTPRGVNLFNLRFNSRNFLSSWAFQTDNPNRPKSYPKLLTDLATLPLPKEANRAALVEEIQQFLKNKETNSTSLVIPEVRFGPWRQRSDNRLEIDHFFSLQLKGNPGAANPAYVALGKVTATTKEPINLEEVPQPPAWEFTSMEVKRIGVMPQPGKNG